MRLRPDKPVDVFAEFEGILRVDDGKTIEDIRELRGWDEYDRQLVDNDNGD